MKLQAFSINQWLYPDTPVTEQTERVELHAARNADVCFQLLSDVEVPAGTVCSWKTDLPEGFRLSVLEVDAIAVPYNSSPAYFVTFDPEESKDFVTRKRRLRSTILPGPSRVRCREAGWLSLYGSMYLRMQRMALAMAA